MAEWSGEEWTHLENLNRGEELTNSTKIDYTMINDIVNAIFYLKKVKEG
jgi:hypothetical protein